MVEGFALKKPAEPTQNILPFVAPRDRNEKSHEPS